MLKGFPEVDDAIFGCCFSIGTSNFVSCFLVVMTFRSRLAYRFGCATALHFLKETERELGSNGIGSHHDGLEHGRQNKFGR